VKASNAQSRIDILETDMLYLALILSLSIFLFCVMQARHLLVPFRYLDRELDDLALAILESEQPPELQRRMGGLKNVHPLSRHLARSLRHVFSEEPRAFAGKSGWLVDPQDFFHVDSLLKNFMQTRRIQSIPSLLTGLGIFFTFLGLTVSTFGLDPTNAEGLTRSVKQLVGGMSLAFSTSLTGIGCSLWWTWRQKGIEQKLENACFKLSQALASKSFIYSEDKWFLWVQDEQRRLLCDVPVQFENILKGKLSMDRQSDPAPLSGIELRTLLEDIKEALNHQNVLLKESFDSVSKKVVEKTLAAATPADEAMAGIQEMVQHIRPLQQNQELAVKSIGEAIRALTESAENSSSSQKNLVRAQDEMNRNLQIIREFWQTYREQLQKLQDALNTGISGFQSHMQETMEHTHGELDRIIAESLTHFSETMSGFDQSVQSLSTVIETLNQWHSKPRKKGLFG
jgi:hypothetical protein